MNTSLTETVASKMTNDIQGWICPRCRATFAPWVSECRFCAGNRCIEIYEPRWPRTPNSGDPLPELPTITCRTKTE